MKVPTHRLECYVAFAACGSGAVGVAVSPVHADIQYFGSEFTLNLPGGDNTAAKTGQSISDGGVTWALVGFREAVSVTGTVANSGPYSFYYRFEAQRQSQTAWQANGSQIGPNLLSAGAIVDSAEIDSGAAALDLFQRQAQALTSYARLTVYSNSQTFVQTYGQTLSQTDMSGAISLGGRGFLALGLELDGETVFGWADISLSADGLSLTVHGWAFEDSGAAIVAGQTEGGSTPVPGLGGLAALACGAAGLRRKRDRVA